MSAKSSALMASRLEAAADFLMAAERTPRSAMLEALFVGMIAGIRHRERIGYLVADFLGTDVGEGSAVAARQRLQLADWIARGDGPAVEMLDSWLADVLARRARGGLT